MRFIKLTVDDKAFYLNAGDITMMTGGQYATEIRLRSQLKYVWCKETPEEIMNLIKKAKEC